MHWLGLITNSANNKCYAENKEPCYASVVTPDSASSYRKKDNDSTKGTAFIHTYAHAHNI